MKSGSETPARGGVRLARENLEDSRGLKVALVSHCLLNPNARYSGGAACQGLRKETVSPYAEAGFGIVQMRCPEMMAWGGPWKPLMWLNYGRGSVTQALSRIIFPGFLAWTKFIYRREARRVAREALSWARAGWRVESVVGIDGSPSCGVVDILDMRRCLAMNGDPAITALDQAGYNRRLYSECLAKGRGLFMAALEKALARRGLHPAFAAWDLVAELGCRPPKGRG